MSRIKIDIENRDILQWSDGTGKGYSTKDKCLNIDIEEGHMVDRFLSILKLADIKLTEIEKTEEFLERTSETKIRFCREMLDELLDQIDENERFLKQL